MSLMNWITKGFRVEHKSKETDNAPPTQSYTPPEVTMTTPPSPQEQAAAVLFNYDSNTNTNNYQASQPAQNYNQQGFNANFTGATIGNRHILIISPRNDDEIRGIVEHLRTNEAVIVNFEGVPIPETQRRIDFLSGVACGLGGTIRPLDTNKFILTPGGIGIGVKN